MKKLAIITAFAATSALIIACGNQSSPKVSADTISGTDQSAVTQNTNAAQDTAGSIGTENKGTTVATSSKGATLIAQSDCLGCHKERDKLVGPSYLEVSKKYTSKDIDKLAGKIMKGGSGSFGDIPMAPHPSISAADAKEMVKYILTIK